MFFQWMTTENKWLWAHLLLAAFLANILQMGFIATIAGGPLTEPNILLTVFATAVVWEFIEFKWVDVVGTYGTFERFFADAVGDVLGGLAAAAMVVFHF